MHVAYRTGTRHPLTMGASGKAILAGHAPQPNEPPDVAAARRRGYVQTEGELQSGAVGLAAPIRVGAAPPEASVAVVSLAPLGPECAPRVVDAADRISRALTDAML